MSANTELPGPAQLLMSEGMLGDLLGGGRKLRSDALELLACRQQGVGVALRDGDALDGPAGLGHVRIWPASVSR